MRAGVVRALLAAVVGVAAWCVGAGAAFAAPGDLDTSFGTGGVLTTDFAGNSDDGYAVAVDSQSRIVVAGTTFNGISNDFAIARYTSAGVLDTSFGTNGKVTTDLGATDEAYGVTVDSDDRVIVAGSSYNGSDHDVAVARYTTDGVLDNTFGTGGTVATDFDSSNDYAYGVAIDSAGRIVVAGRSHNGSNWDFAVARYTAGGTLDTSFGTAGTLRTDFGSGNDHGQGVAVDSEGRILVAGYARNSGGDDDFAVARYTTDGLLDTSFGSNGKQVADFGNSEYGYGVAIDSESRIIVSGWAHNGSDWDFAIARYTADGPLDTAFGSDGKVTTDLGNSHDYAQAVTTDLDDRVVVAGYRANGDDNFAVARYTPAGVLDTSFGGGDGIVTTPLGPGDNDGSGVVVDSAGRIVVAGSSDNGSDLDFAVARYLAVSVPGAATGVAGLSGDGQVALSWVAPASNGGAVVTDYVVEVSSDAGATWSVFADGTSSSTSAVVNGLSNGVSYVVRVSAVNSAGAGPVSVASTSVTPAPAGCTIVGTPGDDVLYGTNGADHICGLGGNDKIYGKRGNDILDGGKGNDVLKGGKGRDWLYGRGGADVLKGGLAIDRLYGNGGADVLRGGPGNDKLVGGSNRDRLYGGGGADWLHGNKGRDTLYGGKGSDQLFGGKGWDVLVGGLVKDWLYGGKGKDKAKKPGPDVLVSIEIVVP